MDIFGTAIDGNGFSQDPIQGMLAAIIQPCGDADRGEGESVGLFASSWAVFRSSQMAPGGCPAVEREHIDQQVGAFTAPIPSW